MKRKIINIDQNKCNGCGLCVDACHEGALALVDGKAKLISESYCDGLGDCLPECPTGAITIVERESEAYDHAAVQTNMAKKKAAASGCSCPGSRALRIEHAQASPAAPAQTAAAAEPQAQLAQWPCQIKLVPVNAPYFAGARPLIAASCSAFSYASMHEKFMKGKITLIGCPKLDGVDYADKLTEIIKNNDIRSVQVVRMSVPCCGGLTNAVMKALQQSGKMLPWSVATITTDGHIIEE